MTDYRILSENLPDTLKNKPRWVKFIIFIAGLAIITLSAVGAGIFIGYMYCYMAHGTGFSTVNATQLENLQLLEEPVGISKEKPVKGTINDAILSQMQNILKIGHKVWDSHPYNLDEKEEIL